MYQVPCTLLYLPYLYTRIIHIKYEFNIISKFYILNIIKQFLYYFQKEKTLPVSNNLLVYLI